MVRASSPGSGVSQAPRREPGAYSIAVLGRALRLLDVLEQAGPLTLTQLGDRAGVNKATTLRILANLEDHGYVQRDDATAQFRLGFRLLQLGARVMASLDLRTVARPWLTRLQAETGETVNLAIPRGRGIVYIDILETVRGLRMTAPVGSEDHLHSTALGKAMLAGWSAEQAATALRGLELVTKTPNTIVDRAQLLREIGAIRQRGYAVDHEENDLGARCVGVALHGHDGEVVGAISVSGPVGRLTVERVPAIAAGVLAVGGQIAEHLGHRAVAAARAASIVGSVTP